jgi:hypothetical protein
MSKVSPSLFEALRCLLRGHNFIRESDDSWYGNLGNPVYELSVHRCERCGRTETLPV